MIKTSRIVLPPKVFELFDKHPNARYYVIAGGRGKGATWSIGQELVRRSLEKERFILCTREVKDSVDQSSRRTIERLIKRMGLQDYFIFRKTETICKRTGSFFFYTGLSKLTENNVQGLEGVTDLWLAEAHTMEMSTIQKTLPTIREEGSTVFVDYNTQESTTPVHRIFTENPLSWPFEGKKSMPELAYLFMTYEDNPFLPSVLEKQRQDDKKMFSTAEYEWIWLGKLKDAAEKYLCDERLVREAMSRNIHTPKYGRIFIGADIARMGGDEIVFYKRKGNKVLDFKAYRMMRTTETVRKLEEFAEYDREVQFILDAGNMGVGIADELVDREYMVDTVNFGGKPRIDVQHSADCVTDMAFNLVERLKKADIPEDDKLCSQIVERKWDFVNETGLRRLETKKSYATHATSDDSRSPDRFDALMLCFYALDDEKEDESCSMVLLPELY